MISIIYYSVHEQTINRDVKIDKLWQTYQDESCVFKSHVGPSAHTHTLIIWLQSPFDSELRLLWPRPQPKLTNDTSQSACNGDQSE